VEYRGSKSDFIFNLINVFKKISFPGQRAFSTSTCLRFAEIVYKNVDKEKLIIISENTNKSGIYMWTNLINGKRYIGSSENLNRRFSEYFNTNHLNRYNYMYICRALLKHGYFNFSLTILEYCEPEKCLEREGYYQKTFKPEYNIAKEPGAPMSGRKHSEKTKTIMSDAKKGTNHPNYGKTLSDETKKILSEAKKGKPRAEGAGKPSQQIEVIDIKNNITTSYNSISEAARTLNINNATIVKYFANNQQSPYKGRYIFKKLH
jgi:group I intron endonuclease